MIMVLATTSTIAVMWGITASGPNQARHPEPRAGEAHWMTSTTVNLELSVTESATLSSPARLYLGVGLKHALRAHAGCALQFLTIAVAASIAFLVPADLECVCRIDPFCPTSH
jgi:hypothetical protein